MKKFAIVPAMVVALAAVTSAQDAVQKFRSGTSMVALNVTVMDGGKLVTGLTREQFEVYEDGVQQDVRFFESRSIPMDVILLLDTSSSMRDKMSTVHDAAKGFMEVLRDGDRGAVVAFNERVNIVQALTSDREAIARAISSTDAKGSTALHNALYVALKEFGRPAQSQDEVRRQAIAILSDGEDTSSVIGFDRVVELARKTGVAIYTISLQSEFASLRQASGRRYFSEADHAMRTLAKETGARSFFPESVHQLRHVYASISEELEAQYSLAYAPSNSRPDGRFRRIVVRVTADPSFKPRARAGYTAEGLRVSTDGAESMVR